MVALNLHWLSLTFIGGAVCKGATPWNKEGNMERTWIQTVTLS